MLTNYIDNGERGLVSEFIWGIVGTEQACNDQEHSKIVITVLIIIALEIFDSVKYLLNGNATHTERGIKKKKIIIIGDYVHLDLRFMLRLFMLLVESIVRK